MTNQSKKGTGSFSAFSSASEEARRHDTKQRNGGDANAGRGGANASPDEITTLERRVRAHERILQALPGHLADDDPEILAQLKRRFGRSHNLGEYEQDYVLIDHYVQKFIRSIEAEVSRRKREYDNDLS